MGFMTNIGFRNRQNIEEFTPAASALPPPAAALNRLFARTLQLMHLRLAGRSVRSNPDRRCGSPFCDRHASLHWARTLKKAAPSGGGVTKRKLAPPSFTKVALASVVHSPEATLARRSRVNCVVGVAAVAVKLR